MRWRVAFAGLAIVAGCTRPVPAAVVPSTIETAAPPVATTSTTVAPTTTSASTSTFSTSTTSTSTTSTSTTSTSTTSTSTTSSTTSTSTTTTSSSTTSTTTPTTVPAPQRTSSIWEVRPPSDLPAPPLPADWVTQSIGTSVLGADIVALRRPVAAPRRTVVVIGGIHGNEPASPPVVRSLVDVALPPDIEVWLVPEMNPDGVARGTRTNANDVDLNRNFGWTWSSRDGGPAPFSEPETQAVSALIDHLRPGLVVWVHQPLGYVSSIGGTANAFEQAWSRGAGLPIRPDVTQHGGGESWTAFTAGSASMLVEIDGWDATPAVVATQQNGFRELVAAL